MFVILMGCGGVDADYDGFAVSDDCDDGDPFVYPGAPEEPGNGADEDCDGQDPPFAIIGDWDVTGFDADYSGFQLFIPGSGRGSLTVAEDLAMVLDVVVTLDPAVAGAPFDLAFEMVGLTSPIPGAARFSLFGETELYNEPVHVNMDCDVTEGDSQMVCAGEIKALSVGYLAVATFDRRAE